MTDPLDDYTPEQREIYDFAFASNAATHSPEIAHVIAVAVVEVATEAELQLMVAVERDLIGGIHPTGEEFGGLLSALGE